MGVQLPGPDDASVEAGFDATGEDMHWQAPRGNDIPGVHMGEGPSMAGLPVGAVSNQGYPNGGSQQGGIDSMEGLEFYGGAAPQGLQDSYNSGPGVMGNGAEPGGDDQAAVGR